MYRDALFVNRSNYGDLHATVAECLVSPGSCFMADDVDISLYYILQTILCDYINILHYM
jgi:hypothetical protein